MTFKAIGRIVCDSTTHKKEEKSMSGAIAGYLLTVARRLGEVGLGWDGRVTRVSRLQQKDET